MNEKNINIYSNVPSNKNKQIPQILSRNSFFTSL